MQARELGSAGEGGGEAAAGPGRQRLRSARLVLRGRRGKRRLRARGDLNVVRGLACVACSAWSDSAMWQRLDRRETSDCLPDNVMRIVAARSTAGAPPVAASALVTSSREVSVRAWRRAIASSSARVSAKAPGCTSAPPGCTSAPPCVPLERR